MQGSTGDTSMKNHEWSNQAPIGRTSGGYPKHPLARGKHSVPKPVIPFPLALSGGWIARALGAIVLTTTLFAAHSISQATESTAKFFMVSAVLKRNGSDSVIKLIHSYTRAKNNRDAETLLRSRVKDEFRGYAVLDVLATELDSDDSTCRDVLPSAVFI
jgi:hypothetical protein